MSAAVIPFPSNRCAPGESIEELTETLVALLKLVDETTHKLATLMERETEKHGLEFLRD